MARKKVTEYTVPGLDPDLAPFDSPGLMRIVRGVGLLAKANTPKQWRANVNSLNVAAKFWQLRQSIGQAPGKPAVRTALASLNSAANRILKLLPVEYEESIDPEPPDEKVEAELGVVPWQPLKQFRRQNPNATAAATPIGKHVLVNPKVVDGIAYPLDEPMCALMMARLAAEADAYGNGPTAAEVFGADSPGDSLLVLVELLTVLQGASKLAMKKIDAAAKSETVAGAVNADPVSADLQFFDALCKIYAELFGKAPALSRDKTVGKPGGPFLRFASACFTALGDPRPDETIASWYRDRRVRQKKQALQT